jgi:hypothetical protein
MPKAHQAATVYEQPPAQALQITIPAVERARVGGLAPILTPSYPRRGARGGTPGRRLKRL